MYSAAWQIKTQITAVELIYSSESPVEKLTSGSCPINNSRIFETLIESATGCEMKSLVSPVYLQFELQSQQPADYPLLLLVSNIMKVKATPTPAIIRVPERIDDAGNVITELAESAINKVLREIYRYKPRAKVVTALENSWLNPVHERTMHNLLWAAGYKNLAVAHQPDSFIPVLPFIHQILDRSYVTKLFDYYLKQIRQESGQDIFLEITYA